MNIKTLTDNAEAISTDYAQQFDIERTADYFMLKLTEEVGEMTQSYLKYQGQARDKPDSSNTFRTEFEDELADVLGTVLLIAKHHDIDIEQAITRKWLKYLPK